MEGILQLTENYIGEQFLDFSLKLQTKFFFILKAFFPRFHLHPLINGSYISEIHFFKTGIKNVIFNQLNQMLES
jgi:hypothetical protein